ncbi:hypothetical protein QZH41_000205 [Actinostola sp. cb2023]|nr:hypothetical protein QZH41_000205 [Actinostola sp. cb2023]
MAAKEIQELDIGVSDSEEHNEDKIRKSDRERKIVQEYAGYFDDLHLGRLKSDLAKIDKEIEAIIYSLSGLDVKQNPAEVQTEFDKLDRKWLTYQEAYSEYTEQITNTTELEQIGIRKQEIDRKINDCRSSIIGILREPSNKNTCVEVDDANSVISRVSSRSTSSNPLPPPVDNVGIHSTPKQQQALDVGNYQLPFSTIQKSQPEANVKQDNIQRYQFSSSAEGANLADSLVQMSHQLVGVVKQNADATTVMRTMLQRQGIPKPIPTRFTGNPSQFPVFKNRVADWLDEKGFTDREKVTHLLSFVDGEAREAIEHLETEKNGFVEAMEILEERYGHPASVVKSCIQQITDGPRIERGAW